MKECPRCFWLAQHKQWKRPAGIFSSLPSGMDIVLKKHFDNFRDKGIMPPELCDKGHCEGMRLFGCNHKEECNLKIWRNNFKGISWTDKEGNILHGAVDNILVKGNKLVVLDYKTRGFALKEDTHEHYQTQLDIYNFLLKKNGEETEDYGFLLFYYPREVLPTGEFVFETKLIKMKANHENVEKLFKDAIKLLNGPCPEGTCEWCEKV